MGACASAPQERPHADIDTELLSRCVLPLEEWSAQDVYQWLVNCESGQLKFLARQFRSKGVAGDLLPIISDDDLKTEFKVSNIAHRLRFRKARTQLIDKMGVTPDYGNPTQQSFMSTSSTQDFHGSLQVPPDITPINSHLSHGGGGPQHVTVATEPIAVSESGLVTAPALQQISSAPTASERRSSRHSRTGVTISDDDESDISTDEEMGGDPKEFVFISDPDASPAPSDVRGVAGWHITKNPSTKSLQDFPVVPVGVTLRLPDLPPDVVSETPPHQQQQQTQQLQQHQSQQPPQPSSSSLNAPPMNYSYSAQPLSRISQFPNKMQPLPTLHSGHSLIENVQLQKRKPNSLIRTPNLSQASSDHQSQSSGSSQPLRMQSQQNGNRASQNILDQQKQCEPPRIVDEESELDFHSHSSNEQYGAVDPSHMLLEDLDLNLDVLMGTSPQHSDLKSTASQPPPQISSRNNGNGVNTNTPGNGSPSSPAMNSKGKGGHSESRHSRSQSQSIQQNKPSHKRKNSVPNPSSINTMADHSLQLSNAHSSMVANPRAIPLQHASSSALLGHSTSNSATPSDFTQDLQHIHKLQSRHKLISSVDSGERGDTTANTVNPTAEPIIPDWTDVSITRGVSQAEPQHWADNKQECYLAFTIAFLLSESLPQISKHIRYVEIGGSTYEGIVGSILFEHMKNKQVDCRVLAGDHRAVLRNSSRQDARALAQKKTLYERQHKYKLRCEHKKAECVLANCELLLRHRYLLLIAHKSSRRQRRLVAGAFIRTKEALYRFSNDLFETNRSFFHSMENLNLIPNPFANHSSFDNTAGVNNDDMGDISPSNQNDINETIDTAVNETTNNGLLRALQPQPPLNRAMPPHDSQHRRHKSLFSKIMRPKYTRKSKNKHMNRIIPRPYPNKLVSQNDISPQEFHEREHWTTGSNVEIVQKTTQVRRWIPARVDGIDPLDPNGEMLYIVFYKSAQDAGSRSYSTLASSFTEHTICVSRWSQYIRPARSGVHPNFHNVMNRMAVSQNSAVASASTSQLRVAAQFGDFRNDGFVETMQLARQRSTPGNKQNGNGLYPQPTDHTYKNMNNSKDIFYAYPQFTTHT